MNWWTEMTEDEIDVLILPIALMICIDFEYLVSGIDWKKKGKWRKNWTWAERCDAGGSLATLNDTFFSRRSKQTKAVPLNRRSCSCSNEYVHVRWEGKSDIFHVAKSGDESVEVFQKKSCHKWRKNLFFMNVKVILVIFRLWPVWKFSTLLNFDE